MHHPCPYQARAWWGEHLLAESSGAVLVEPSEGGQELYFPLADIRLDRLVDEGRERTRDRVGSGRLWSIDLPWSAPGGRPSREWGAGEGEVTDGKDILCGYEQPGPGMEWLAGLATFDHDRVTVELVDSVPGEDERDASVKQFPAWGDAGHLIDMLDVRSDGTGAYDSVARTDGRRPVVEGSQMLGQAIVAAGRHSPGRRVVSAHMVFTRAADAAVPLRFEVDELTHGRTFSTLVVQVGQAGRRCATGIFLLGDPAPDVIRHAAPAPATPGPYESVPYDMGVLGRNLRVVDGAYTDDPEAPVGPPVIDAWVRFRSVPDDPYLHAALLAQFTGHMPIAAALRAHEGIGQREAHRTLSTAINAIGISFHADVRADQWMLYHHDSTFAGDGMTHAACRVHDEGGRLVASFTVDAMVRKFAPSSVPVDDRTAL